MRLHTRTNAQADAPARRQGYTLIEMLIAISVGSSIMLTAVALVHTTFKLQSQAQSRLERANSLDRYVEQFRRDAARAARVELPTDKTLRVFLDEGRRVEYTVEESRVIRRAYTGDELWQTESVQLAAGHTARFAQAVSERCVAFDIVERESAQSATEKRADRQTVVALGTTDGAGGQR